MCLKVRSPDLGPELVDPLLVAADVGAHVALDHRVHDPSRLLVARLHRHGVALGAEAGEEARLVGGEGGKVPGRQRVGEPLGQARRAEHQHVVEVAPDPAAHPLPADARNLLHRGLPPAVDHHGHRPRLVVDRAALPGVLGAGLGVVGPVGGVDPLHGAPGAGVGLEIRGGEPEPPQPAVHRLPRLPLAQQERQLRLRLDLPRGAGVGDDRRGAERALPRMRVGAQLDLRPAVRAAGEARLLHLGRRQGALLRRAQVELGDRAAHGGDRLLVAAVRALQPVGVRVEAQVRAARRTGEAVVLKLDLLARACRAELHRRAPQDAGGGGGALKSSASSETSRPRCQSGPPGVQSQLSPVTCPSATMRPSSSRV